MSKHSLFRWTLVSFSLIGLVYGGQTWHSNYPGYAWQGNSLLPFPVRPPGPSDLELEMGICNQPLAVVVCMEGTMAPSRFEFSNMKQFAEDVVEGLYKNTPRQAMMAATFTSYLHESTVWTSSMSSMHKYFLDLSYPFHWAGLASKNVIGAGKYPGTWGSGFLSPNAGSCIHHARLLRSRVPARYKPLIILLTTGHSVDPMSTIIQAQSAIREDWEILAVVPETAGVTEELRYSVSGPQYTFIVGPVGSWTKGDANAVVRRICVKLKQKPTDASYGPASGGSGTGGNLNGWTGIDGSANGGTGMGANHNGSGIGGEDEGESGIGGSGVGGNGNSNSGFDGDENGGIGGSGIGGIGVGGNGDSGVDGNGIGGIGVGGNGDSGVNGNGIGGIGVGGNGDSGVDGNGIGGIGVGGNGDSGVDGNGIGGIGINGNGNSGIGGAGIDVNGNEGAGIDVNGNGRVGIDVNGNGGSGINVNGNGGAGIDVSGNGGAGIDVNGNGGAGIDVNGNGGAGIDVNGNGGAGTDVNGNGGAGIDVNGNGGAGIDVNGNGGAGIDVNGNGGVGIDVNGNGGAGIDVNGNGGAGIDVNSNGGAGIDVNGNGGAGIDVNSNGGAGIDVNGNGGAGIDVNGNGGAGIDVNGNGGAGIDVNGNGGAGIDVNGNGGAGIDVNGNDGAGIDVNGNSGAGIDVNDNGDTGIEITDEVGPVLPLPCIDVSGISGFFARRIAIRRARQDGRCVINDGPPPAPVIPPLPALPPVQLPPLVPVIQRPILDLARPLPAIPTAWSFPSLTLRPDLFQCVDVSGLGPGLRAAMLALYFPRKACPETVTPAPGTGTQDNCINLSQHPPAVRVLLRVLIFPVPDCGSDGSTDPTPSSLPCIDISFVPEGLRMMAGALLWPRLPCPTESPGPACINLSQHPPAMRMILSTLLQPTPICDSSTGTNEPPPLACVSLDMVPLGLRLLAKTLIWPRLPCPVQPDPVQPPTTCVNLSQHPPVVRYIMRALLRPTPICGESTSSGESANTPAPLPCISLNFLPDGPLRLLANALLWPRLPCPDQSPGSSLPPTTCIDVSQHPLEIQVIMKVLLRPAPICGDTGTGNIDPPAQLPCINLNFLPSGLRPLAKVLLWPRVQCSSDSTEPSTTCINLSYLSLEIRMLLKFIIRPTRPICEEDGLEDGVTPSPPINCVNLNFIPSSLRSVAEAVIWPRSPCPPGLPQPTLAPSTPCINLSQHPEETRLIMRVVLYPTPICDNDDTNSPSPLACINIDFVRPNFQPIVRALIWPRLACGSQPTESTPIISNTLPTIGTAAPSTCINLSQHPPFLRVIMRALLFPATICDGDTGNTDDTFTTSAPLPCINLNFVPQSLRFLTEALIWPRIACPYDDDTGPISLTTLPVPVTTNSDNCYDISSFPPSIQALLRVMLYPRPICGEGGITVSTPPTNPSECVDLSSIPSEYRDMVEALIHPLEPCPSATVTTQSSTTPATTQPTVQSSTTPATTQPTDQHSITTTTVPVTVTDINPSTLPPTTPNVSECIDLSGYQPSLRPIILFLNRPRQACPETNQSTLAVSVSTTEASVDETTSPTRTTTKTPATTSTIPTTIITTPAATTTTVAPTITTVLSTNPADSASTTSSAPLPCIDLSSYPRSIRRAILFLNRPRRACPDTTEPPTTTTTTTTTTAVTSPALITSPEICVDISGFRPADRPKAIELIKPLLPCPIPSATTASTTDVTSPDSNDQGGGSNSGGFTASSTTGICIDISALPPAAREEAIELMKPLKPCPLTSTTILNSTTEPSVTTTSNSNGQGSITGTVTASPGTSTSEAICIDISGLAPAAREEAIELMKPLLPCPLPSTVEAQTTVSTRGPSTGVVTSTSEAICIDISGLAPAARAEAIELMKPLLPCPLPSTVQAQTTVSTTTSSSNNGGPSTGAVTSTSEAICIDISGLAPAARAEAIELMKPLLPCPLPLTTEATVQSTEQGTGSTATGQAVTGSPVDPESSSSAVLCEGCFVIGFLGYNPHPSRCNAFVMCSRTSATAIWTHNIINCPPTLLWSQDVLTCVRPAASTCFKEQCTVSSPTASIPVQPNCPLYIDCANPASLQCCPADQVAVNNSCISAANTGCPLSCVVQTSDVNNVAVSTVQSTTQQGVTAPTVSLCDVNRPVDEEPYRFQTWVELSGWVSQRCPPYTIFSTTICVCVLDPSYQAPVWTSTARPECTPLLDMQVAAGSVTNIASFSWINNTNVDLNGTSGSMCFTTSDTSHIRVPVFNNMELGEKLRITVILEVPPSSSDEQMAILGNCARGLHIIPSFYLGVVYERGSTYIQAEILTDAVSTPVQLRLKYDGGRTVVDIDYTGTNVTLSVGPFNQTADLVGSIPRRQSDLLIGYPIQTNDQFFQGCLYQVKVTKCDE